MKPVFKDVKRVNFPNGAVIACVAQREDGGWSLYKNLEATPEQIEEAVADLMEQIKEVME